jgi:renalase
MSDRVYSNSSSCLIIGGGISGLITATILQRKGIKVTVLDKGRGIGGRLATRRIKYSKDIEGVFDYGTQYFKVSDPQFKVWVDDWLEQNIVTQWCRGFANPDDQPRYRGVGGTRNIAKYLAQDLDVRTNTKLIKLNWQDSRWQIETEDNVQFQGDILVMTPPVPQSLALLDVSHIVLPREIRNRLEQISYHRCLAVLALLETASNIPAPGGLALEEPLVWITCNHQKGISPKGYGVTLHATPDFSETHWDEDEQKIAQQLLAAASPWLNSKILEYQVHRWRYSLPKTFYGEPYLALSELPLIMIGDAFMAPKLEGAVRSAIAAAECILCCTN